MYLKSIDLFGFKSFPEKTHIEFGPGITVIVGPNGCGKSNIVDSLRWVLGEKHAKAIRGTRMEDVIFSGTEIRKPLSLAEVSITIDNSEKILNFDSPTVTITRRLFRDGESEYLINKSPVRLKDIDQLFLDTGIGKANYSIMEQGKIDLILSTSAEDRRVIFEEAAGISKYKLQKKESLKKLQDTSANLERINDIIKEIEREKELKAKQAEKTKKYLALRAELADYDVKYHLARYTEISTRRRNLIEEIEKLKRIREEISARVSKISSENEEDEKLKNDIQLRLFELDKELHANKIRIEDIDVRSEKNRKEIENQNFRKLEIEKKIAERRESLSRVIEEKNKSEQSMLSIREQLKEDRQKINAFNETKRRKVELIANSRNEIEKNKQLIGKIERHVEELRENLNEVVKKLIDAIEKRKAELADSEEKRQVVRGRIHETIQQIGAKLHHCQLLCEAGDCEGALAVLKEIDVQALASDLIIFESFEDGFRSILFDRTGIHAQKESLDKSIESELQRIENLKERNLYLEELIRREQCELDDIKEMIVRLEKDVARRETEMAWTEKHVETLVRQIADFERQIESHKEEIKRCDLIISNCQNEIEQWEKSLMQYSEKTEELNRDIRQLVEKRAAIESKIEGRKNVSRKDMEMLRKIVEKIGDLDKDLIEINFKLERIEEYLWTEHEKKVSDLKNIVISESEVMELQKNIQELKKKIQDLGPVNNLAIEEYRDLKKRFDYYINQKKDIEKARDDILSVIEEINSTSIEMFMKTFQSIRKNFSEIFKQLFEGGNAEIELVDNDNVLESGIEIIVQPPGKKHKNINLLSGGERALVAIALLFATYMEKPSPFCFLDEIDAPLDEENIGRFIKMVREFSRKSQFIIVTHNKKTMSTAEVIYGITMAEPGVSKVVSLKMEKLERKTS
ncbi:MAG: AAA family ATPase [Spirochaetes bacterium]|nr:AAA family ATPase [Spirochaetota bacterium]